MSLLRLENATHIADRLNELAAMVKTRSRASLTDANHILETIAKRFFNALLGWDLANLNTEQANFPAADLGDRHRRIAIQVTNADGSNKIEHTAAKAMEHHLGNDFDRLIIFFLLQEKPGFPKKFVQPPNGPKVETWDIADLLKLMQEMSDLDALARAAKVLDEEMGKLVAPETRQMFDIPHILKYAPDKLIGREEETKLLNDAWAKTQNHDTKRPHILTLVALGGEGKTSLVAKWAAELAAQDWPGCDAAFAWSFYSQGTREQLAASSDLFLKAALTFFGDDADKAFATSSAGAFEKGQRLARLVGQRRSLLILDGLEPLQYAPTAPTPGELKDQGLAALLKGLSAASHGLCIVTTRYSLPDLKAFWQTTAPEVKLLRLSPDAGMHLLKTLGVRGTAQEFAALVEDVKGHALTLTLLGGFLKRAFHGDIRQRDRVKFEKADEKMDGGHAFRTMATYEQWLMRDGGDEGRREVAVLRLMGLFDRPADAGCLAALRSETIPGLTEPLAGLADDDWEYCLSGLEATKLLTVNRDESGALISLDAHPHLREYFARQLREQNPEAWRAAHRRLYEHLCANTKEGDHPTLEDLQPLYQAVAHGCQAGLQQEAWGDVYIARIYREGYSSGKLGAFGQDLGAMAFFFDPPWRELSSNLLNESRVVVLDRTATCLRSLGRISEALELMRASADWAMRHWDWLHGAVAASHLSNLDLTLGEVADALCDAEKSVAFARHGIEVASQAMFTYREDDSLVACLSAYPALGDALHQAGRRAEAETHFREAEQMQAELQPACSLLYSGEGARYCDLLLAAPEHAAWQQCNAGVSPAGSPGVPPGGSGGETPPELAAGTAALLASCRAISQRAAQTLKWAEQARQDILSPSLDHLTLGRAALYEAILGKSEIQNSKSEIEKAVDGLRRSGNMDDLPRGLLTRAWLRFLDGACTGPESAQEDLDEAWEIAERGPMKLFLADIHLYRARLFAVRNAECGVGNEKEKYPWESPAADLAAAEKLINDCGYHRRDEELADAKKAILGLS
jgi:tetratricopeptide (TPR) repeat protein